MEGAPHERGSNCQRVSVSHPLNSFAVFIVLTLSLALVQATVDRGLEASKQTGLPQALNSLRSSFRTAKEPQMSR